LVWPGNPGSLVKGVIDHMTFTGKNLAGMVAKLKARGNRYDLRRPACPTTAPDSSSSTIRTTPRSSSILRRRPCTRSAPNNPDVRDPAQDPLFDLST